MKPIGGYFELELSKSKNIFHNDLIAVNSGRSALKLILQHTAPQIVYVPYYTCDVTLEPINELKIPFKFYRIDKDLAPAIDKIESTAVLLYVNYFGVSERNVERVSEMFSNVIIDNSQSFYSNYIEGIPTFYSPRKFFGLPDGGFTYIPKLQDHIQIKAGTSFEKCSHLLKRIDLNAEAAYEDFQRNDKKLSSEGLTRMSSLTQSLLQNINFDEVAEKRKHNFAYLHKRIHHLNLFKTRQPSNNVPLVYPFLSEKHSLREFLISNKIFVAKYWPNVTSWFSNKNSIEHYLTNNLLALPIDQRYGEEEMDFVAEKIISYYGK